MRPGGDIAPVVLRLRRGDSATGWIAHAECCRVRLVWRAGCRWDTDNGKRGKGGTRMRSRSDGCIRGPGWLLTVPEGAHFGEAGGGRRFRRPQRFDVCRNPNKLRTCCGPDVLIAARPHCHPPKLARYQSMFPPRSVAVPFCLTPRICHPSLKSTHPCSSEPYAP